MSATKDKDQKVKFIFPNLYKLQSKKEQKKPKELTVQSRVLKAEDLRNQTFGSVRVNPYTPMNIIGQKVNKPSSLSSQPQNQAINQLKQNLSQLNDLQARLKFMLQELEELIKEE